MHQVPTTAAIYGRLSRTLVRSCMYTNPVVKSWALIGHHLLILVMHVYRSCYLRVLLGHPSLMLMIPCQFELRTMMPPASSSAKCLQRARDLPKVPAVAQGLLDNAHVLAFVPPELLSLYLFLQLLRSVVSCSYGRLHVGTLWLHPSVQCFFRCQQGSRTM